MAARNRRKDASTPQASVAGKSDISLATMRREAKGFGFTETWVSVPRNAIQFSRFIPASRNAVQGTVLHTVYIHSRKVATLVTTFPEPQVVMNGEGEILCEKPHLVQRMVSFKVIKHTMKDHSQAFTDWNDLHLSTLCGGKVISDESRQKRLQAVLKSTRLLMFKESEHNDEAGESRSDYSEEEDSDDSETTHDSVSWRKSSPGENH